MVSPKGNINAFDSDAEGRASAALEAVKFLVGGEKRRETLYVGMVHRRDTRVQAQ